MPLEQAADRKVLLDALGRISREERQIVLLHAAAGMKHREVAAVSYTHLDVYKRQG